MRLTVYLVFFGIVSFFILAATQTPVLPIEDAYITFRYVQNWLAGDGLVFNPGERVEAHSNFLWAALLGGLGWLGLTPPVGARVLSWGSLVGCSSIIALLVRRRIPEAPAAAHLAAGLAFGLLPATIFHALSGMETVLTAFLLILFAWLLDAGVEKAVGAAAVGLCLASIAMARPEGLLFCMLVLLALGALRLLSAPARPRVEVVAFGCLIPLAIFFAWRWFYYGDLLPNSVTAKSAGVHLSILLGGVLYLGRFVISTSPLLVAAAISFLAARREDIIVLRMPALCTYLAVALLGGHSDGYPHTRYLFPLVPLLLVWSFEGIWFICRVSWEKRGPVVGRLLGLSLVAVVLVIQAFLSFTEYYLTRMPFDPRGFVTHPLAAARAFFEPDISPHLAGAPREALGHHQMAEWLRQHASSEDVLAIYEIGIIPYYSGLRVIDLFGLADRTIAKSPGLPGGRLDPAYALGRAPKYMAYRVSSACLCFYYPVFRSPEFRDNYDLVAVSPYQDTHWLLFERRQRPVARMEHSLGWDPFSDQLITGPQALSARVIPLETRGPVRLDPYLQRTEPLQKERLFSEIMKDPASESGRNAMRQWLETFRKAFVLLPGLADPPASLEWELAIPPQAVLEFEFGAGNESSTAFDGQSFDVSVKTAGGSETLFRRDFSPVTALEPGWEKLQISLDRFSGQRVRLSFSRSKCARPLQIAIGEPRILRTDLSTNGLQSSVSLAEGAHPISVNWSVGDRY